MNNRVKLVVFFLCFWTLGVRGQIQSLSSHDSVSLTVIYVDQSKSKEKIYLGINDIWREVNKSQEPTAIDSANYMLSTLEPFNQLIVQRYKRALGIKYLKEHRLKIYYQGQKYFVIQMDKKMKRRHRFIWYWTDDLRHVRL